MRRTTTIMVMVSCVAFCLALCAASQVAAIQGNAKPKADADSPSSLAKWAPAVKPKPLSANVLRGLRWLTEHQHPTGGWGQGEESPQMAGSSQAQLKDIPNVADTCAAALALIRSGSMHSSIPCYGNIISAVKYVCNEVQESDANSMYITKLRDTRLQMKLGTYIDTFMASLLFAEVAGKMPDPQSENMVKDAFNKVMDKIERNQRPDGTFGETGWASTLSQSMASKGMNRAAQSGLPVSEQVRSRLEGSARGKYDRASGKFSPDGSASVELYAGAATLGAIQDSDNTNSALRDKVQKQLTSAQTPAEKTEAQQMLRRFDETSQQLQSARDAITARLDDKQFIAGFGSNGGEEFLSYMNIGESLVVKGGQDWEKWDKDITANLNRIQNADGSWTGHHCITGRTFCTSAALLVLMTDRAPVPVAAKMQRR